MLYAALLTPLLALPALLLMDRLDRWAARPDRGSVGDGRVGAHPKPARPPVGGRRPGHTMRPGFGHWDQAPVTRSGRPGRRRALT
jgi:hypothetical protein